MNNDELMKRIFDKFDNFEAKLDKTCDTISKMNTELQVLKKSVDDHLKEREKAENDKSKKFYVIMALMTVGFTLFEVTQSLL